MKARGVTLLVTVCALAACGSSDVPSSATPPLDAEATSDLVITRDVAIDDVTTADVFAPVGTTDLPVVVMFHGTEGLRSNMEPLAVDLARSDAVVVVPSWPVITERPPQNSTTDPYHDQVVAAVCAVRFARSTATEYGGDPDDLTVMGHSGGAPVGIRVALVDEPPWDDISCYPGVDSHVDRFVGTASDFTSDYQFASWIPDLYRPYDVFDLDVTNHALEVRLFHGGADTNVWVGQSTNLDEHLRGLGIDSDVTYVETAHGDLIDPSTPAGRFVDGQLDALVHGRVSDLGPQETRATITFTDDRCSFEQSKPVELGRPLRVRLVADHSDMPVWFSLVGFEPGLTDAEIAAIVSDVPRSPDDPPRAPIDANFVLVPPGSVGEMTWAIVTDTLRWVAYCMPAAGSSHPSAGMMHPASEVALVP